MILPNKIKLTFTIPVVLRDDKGNIILDDDGTPLLGLEEVEREFEYNPKTK